MLLNYISHKRVQAEPMTRKEAEQKGLVRDAEPDSLADENGYRVVYSDTYESWSPKEAFENGYNCIDSREVDRYEDIHQTFSWAIEALKAGKKVAREGWNGKGMWITLGTGGVVKSEDLWNDNTKAFAETLENKEVEVLPYILMKTADNKLLMGWLASQSDMLAEDWLTIE